MELIPFWGNEEGYLLLHMIILLEPDHTVQCVPFCLFTRRKFSWFLQTNKSCDRRDHAMERCLKWSPWQTEIVWKGFLVPIPPFPSPQNG